MGMAERIKERRKVMGYTQTELGEKLGLQASAIAKYENGRVTNIKRSVIANMAKVLDCSPSYLMGLEVKENTEIPKESFPQIMVYYDSLNDNGKEIATEQVRLLTLDEKYTNPDNVIPIKEKCEHPLPTAAHADDYIHAPEELKQLEDDIMTDENF